jgi:glycosyltransferase involved in cell wall biosynthesis
MLHIHVIDELKIGGAQTHLVTLLREAVKHHGIEHCVVCLFGDGELSGEIRGLGIPVHVLDLRAHFREGRFFAACSELRGLFVRLNPDVVEAHLTWSRFLALFAAWRARVPLRIGFEHGDLYLNSWKFRAGNFITQLFAHRIVVCSEALAGWVRRTHGTFPSKLVVMHNCVDLTRFSENGPRAKDIAFAPVTTVFCAVGTLGAGVNKRVDICIRALAAARREGADVALVVCGDGGQRVMLAELASSLGISAHVKFLGTRSDVAAVLRSCHVLCHAAPFEPFGIVALEAMAVGLAIIAPNSGGIREIVKDGVNGLLYHCLDHGALAKAMLTLAGSPNIRQSMGAAGLRMAQEEFSVQRYLADLYRMYGLDLRNYPVAAMKATA